MRDNAGMFTGVMNTPDEPSQDADKAATAVFATPGDGVGGAGKGPESPTSGAASSFAPDPTLDPDRPTWFG